MILVNIYKGSIVSGLDYFVRVYPELLENPDVWDISFEATRTRNLNPESFISPAFILFPPNEPHHLR